MLLNECKCTSSGNKISKFRKEFFYFFMNEKSVEGTDLNWHLSPGRDHSGTPPIGPGSAGAGIQMSHNCIHSPIKDINEHEPKSMELFTGTSQGDFFFFFFF